MLVLIRHGQSALNAEQRLAGRLDVALTEVGEAQAAATARAVRDLGSPARVISSPLQRAVRTAEALGADVEIDERWVEFDYGDFDGRPIADVPADLWRRWRADASLELPGGTESLETLSERVRGACEQLAETGAPDELVVVVSHVSPIKAAVAWALGVGVEVSWRMFVAPASITVIGTGRNGPALQSFNQTSHLP